MTDPPLPRCMCFKSPGPPWYGAQCVYIKGHSVEHYFGTEEEARKAFYADVFQRIRRGGFSQQEASAGSAQNISNLLVDQISIRSQKQRGRIHVMFSDIDVNLDPASARQIAAELLREAEIAELETLTSEPAL